MTTEALVFDVGGTTLRAAVYRAATDSLQAVERTAISNHWTMPCPSRDSNKAHLFKAMDSLTRKVLGNCMPGVVAVAFAGPIGPDGKVLAAPTIWGGRCRGPVLTREELMDLWPTARVLLLNDVTAAGYRYLTHSDEDLCIVTVSSGIGHKVFLQGRPIVGLNGRGGEIGHLQVDFSEHAPLCDCGGRGHLGAVASGRGSAFQVSRLAALDPHHFAASLLGRDVDGDLGRIDNMAIVQAFHQEDPWTIQLIRQMTQPLGQALAAIHLTVGVERFVIVGGFALALGTQYTRLLADAAASCTWDVGAPWTRMIELGKVDDDAGLLGCGRLATKYVH